VVDRVEAITKNLAMFQDYEPSQLNRLQQEMLPVLQHNQQHLGQFVLDDLERIKQQLEI
jgi:HPt (histidine-containing phosphotransfer) domain-containing protein